MQFFCEKYSEHLCAEKWTFQQCVQEPKYLFYFILHFNLDRELDTEGRKCESNQRRQQVWKIVRVMYILA